MNITISLETPQDIPQVQQVIADAFGSHEEAALVNQLRQDPGWLPALSLVAKDRHGTVIGHVVCTRASVGAHPAVTLAPLSVHPAHQGSGVGSALMLACIEAARRRRENHHRSWASAVLPAFWLYTGGRLWGDLPPQ